MPSEQNDTSQGVPDNTKCPIEGYDNIQDFIKDGYKILMEAIKYSNSMPQGSNWNFYNTHDAFIKVVENESVRILKQINTILRPNQIEGNIRNRSLDEKTELIVEGSDNIMEKVAINIDEMNGIRKTGNAPILIQNVRAELPVNGSWNRVDNATFSVTSSLTSQDSNKSKSNAIRLLTAKNIIRPQKFFKDKIVNSSNFPWEPRIKEKPNSLKPLAIFLEETENGEEYSQAYEFELDRFKPPPEQLHEELPVEPIPVKETPLIEVSKSEQLDELLNTLLTCKEFAVDLEHHSYRTFMGITCLMQISTREKDYLIDTLALRDKLHILNEVFTKPTILKVFHGADSDILWLQRDLSIYVVNMFDTYIAAKQLGYSGLSLAYLLQKFCNFLPNKKFQLADWRIRPLPDELKDYAREDTHYLLYIYQMLKNELLAKAHGKDNLLVSVFTNSTNICKKRYFKPVLREASHMDFYRKCKRLFDNRQMYALKELYKWRDQTAREEDESIGYVLPNHMLLQIAETLPREMQGILACCNPIPPLVRSNLLELHQIILRAKEQPLNKPILQEDTRARGTTKKMSKINVDSQLNCPHDLTKTREFRDDLPTVLGNKNVYHLAFNKIENEMLISKCSVFNTENSDEEQIIKIKEKMKNFKFLGPYERYKLVRPYIEAEEKKIAEAKIASETSQAPETDKRTDEERIESIRELFLSLSKKPPVESPTSENLDRSLLQMGGTKRKRKSSSSPQVPMRQHPVYLPISTDLSQTHNLRKRMSNEAPEGASPAKKKNKNNSAKTKNKNKSKKGNNLTNSQEKPGIENEQSVLGVQGPSSNQMGQQNQRGKNKKNNNRQRKNQQNQSQFNVKNKEKTEFMPFDYSSVDFRQFQGGAGSVAKPQDFKSNYKFKGKKKGGNKGNNRSSTLGMPSRGKGRGGGRGRGRGKSH